jgi:outer membrane protein assembly factor BamB
MPRAAFFLLLLVAALSFLAQADADRPVAAKPAAVSADDADWPMYNADVLGTRHNKAEKKLSAANVADLEEKWRFPAKGAFRLVGAIHATPVVVNGYVYFGTATLPTVYKLAPDGGLKWSYRNPDAANEKVSSSYGVPASGFLNSPLVTNDTVYICDVGGFVIALDRATGKERWKVSTRGKPFPGAHPSNCLFAAPILAAGRVIVAGGGYEHQVATKPKHRCCTGRGFVAAFEPDTGKVAWKYHVGPRPEAFDPPVKLKDDWGEHVFHFGPSTSSVWCTPSWDSATNTTFFGTDTHNAPRKPTKDDPRLYTKHSCAVIAVDAKTGAERWVTQINPGDVWNYSMRAYDPKTGLYKDQSIGDTPKPYTLLIDGKRTKVVGCGCKNGGFYVLDAATGKVLRHTPVYKGPPLHPPKPKPDPRARALPGAMGGLQTGCATDGESIFTNGTDYSRLATAADPKDRLSLPTGGRVTSISRDTRKENWRHERPLVKAVGGTKSKPAFTDVGDPVASGIALANGVAYFTTTVSNKLVALEARSGRVLKEIALGPVWCGPSVSRGRVYVGSGNILFSPFDPKEGYFPKRLFGTLYCFGLPGKDEVVEMGKGKE